MKYVTNVESYDRRIQSAINIQGKKMQRRAEFLLTRALRQAGCKQSRGNTPILRHFEDVGATSVNPPNTRKIPELSYWERQ